MIKCLAGRWKVSLFFSNARNARNIVITRPIERYQSTHSTERVECDIHPLDIAHGCSLDRAKRLPQHYMNFSNAVLIRAAIAGDQNAKKERLIRDIMATNDVTWPEAQPELQAIIKSNRKGLFLATLPYRMTVAAALTVAFGSIPMIFDLDTVLWFNEWGVTADVPEDKDLETPLEVGAWAWNWMEPPLGHASFFLLCMQYARNQLENLGTTPYTKWFLKQRGERLHAEFPQYNKQIVIAFSQGDPLNS